MSTPHTGGKVKTTSRPSTPGAWPTPHSPLPRASPKGGSSRGRLRPPAGRAVEGPGGRLLHSPRQRAERARSERPVGRADGGHRLFAVVDFLRIGSENYRLLASRTKYWRCHRLKLNENSHLFIVRQACQCQTSLALRFQASEKRLSYFIHISPFRFKE